MAWTLEGSASALAPDLAHGSTFAYTVNAASTLLVIAGSNSNVGVTPTITYDGQSFTWVTLDDVIDSSQVCLGYLLSPPTGTHNFANPAAAGNGTYFIADYSGITGVTATATNSQLTGTNLTTSLTAASGDLAVAAASTAHLGTTFVTPTSNMTLVAQDQSFLSTGMYNNTSALTAGTFGAVTETSGSDRQYTAVATFTIGGGGGFTASLSETASAAETLVTTFAVTLSLSETATAGETLGIIGSAALVETANAVDTLTPIFGSSITLSEAASASDAPAVVSTAGLTEAASASETWTAVVGFVNAITETASASDTPAEVLGTFLSLSETASAVDSPGASGVFVASLSETASAADSVTITGATFSATLVEMASAQDNLSVATATHDSYLSLTLGRERTTGTGGLASVVASIAVLVGQGASPTQAAVETMALDMAAFTEYNPQAALFVNVDTTLIVSVSVLREFFNLFVEYAAGAGMKP